MTTAQIQHFLIAAERLNFTVAAEQLYITQPSLSRQIAAIEDELGVKLFDRSSNTLRLTTAGKALYERLSVFYRDYQTIVKEVRDISSGTRGHLNLGVLEDQYIPDRLTLSIRQLLQDNPDCEINITRRDSRALFSGLMDGSLDAGLMLVYDEFGDYGFESINLVSAPAVLAINRDLSVAQKDWLSMEELNGLLEKIPLAMVTPDQFPESLQTSLFCNMPFIGLEESCQVKLLPSIGAVSLYVAMGLAATLTNQGNLLANDPKIKYVAIEGMDTMIQGLVWRRNTQNQLLTQLIEKLKE